MKRIYLYFILLLVASCNKAEPEAQQEQPNAYFDQAYEYVDAGNADSAFLYFDKARQMFVQVNDSLGIAKCLVNMAITQQEQGDYFGAQETALQALPYLDEKDPKQRVYYSTNYNNLGVVSDNLGQSEKALAFYQAAISYATDSTYALVYQNNLAVCYQTLKEYDKALEVYASIKEQVKGNSKQYARVLSNIARTKWLANRSYDALAEFRKALVIRKREKDIRGLNASYAHLSDYFSQRQPDSAIYYARQLLNSATNIRHTQDQIYALGKLVELSPSAEVKPYFKRYQFLSDSLNSARVAARNQFALIRYEVEKNKAENLRLQNENALRMNRLIRQRFATGSLGFALVFLAIVGSIWYKRRKQRLELATANQIKEQQLKTSRKVHDVVANGIYRVMSEIEHKAQLDREGLLDKLEDVYNKSRDISYEVEGDTLPALPSYAEELSDLLTSFASEEHRVLLVGNEEALWQRVRPEIKTELKAVLQECMVNMQKHSGAKQVLCRFVGTATALQVLYKDNGKGRAEGVPYGNGLQNTVSRIQSLQGAIIFAGAEGKGFEINITIPLL